ncbi:hypothetical protein FGF1_34030 [Flavobacteriaceae bacterium GF1]
MSENSVSTIYGNVGYMEIGPQNDETILLSTGGGAGYDAVQAFEWLAQEGFRVVAINRPGYYNLPLEPNYTIETHADIYHEVLTTMGISEKVHVFGVSMGGISALYYANKYPTKSLVLWSAITGKYKVNVSSTNSALGKLVLSKKGKNLISWLLLFSAKYFPKKTIQSFLKTESSLNKKERVSLSKEIVNDPKSKKEFIVFIKSLTPMSALYPGMMDEMVKTTKLGDVNWSGIKCPVFAVYSKIDADVSIDHSQRLAEQISNIKLKYVKAGGHFVWWGKEGEEVKQGTIKFFSKHSS